MRKYQFQAKIEAADGGGAYVVFPFDVQKEFGTKSKVPVNATFNGVPYAGSLMKYGHALHMLAMPKPIRQQTGAVPGDTVRVELWKDDAPRTIEVPAPFAAAMTQAGVRPVFDRLSPTHRREYCRWIESAKKEETRRRRIEKAIQLLKSGVPTPDS